MLTMTVSYIKYCLLKTMQSANDTTDVSFLLETNYHDDRDDTSAKEALLHQQRLQMEQEQQKLLNYATDLAKQVY